MRAALASARAASYSRKGSRAAPRERKRDVATTEVLASLRAWS